MAQIITITFNPALDKNVAVPELISEKKLKCSIPVYEPGGGGINVARAIKKLGGDATSIYLAAGFTGHKIDKLLSAEGIKTEHIYIMGDTRENLIVSELTTGKQYLFDMPGPAINESEWKECLDTLVQSVGVEYIIVSGSLPTGLPEDIFERLASIASKKNAKLIVDTSGKALQHAFEAGAYLLKPNLRELGLLAGKENLAPEMAADVARKLIADSGCTAIIVSLGAHGAILVTGQTAIRITLPEVKVQSTVGAGDSLVAGIVYKLCQNYNLQDATRFGVACGSAATLNPGTELCNKKDAEEIYRLLRVIKLDTPQPV